VMLDMERFRAEIEAEFTRQLAPELAAMGANRVYVLWQCECGHAGNWLGLYHCWLASWYREAIGSRWQGPGPCWILHDRKIREMAKGTEYKSVAEEVWSGLFKDIAWNVSVHEASHSVLIPTLMVDVGDASEECKAIMREIVKTTHTSQAGKTAAQVWIENALDESHGVDFARVATHLAWRIADLRRGVSSGHDPVEIIGLMSATWALRSEIQILKGVPLSEIAKLPPSDGLEREYQRKMRERGLNRWIARQAACVG
jgi:hypothetical protein